MRMPTNGSCSAMASPFRCRQRSWKTLLLLIDNRDRVLTKDELLKQLWGDTIVEEGGLTRNISILRKTLGEKPDDHRFVVTLPARGYQFVAEVREMRGNGEESEAVPDPPPAETGWQLRRARPFARKSLAVAGLAVLFLLAGIAYALRQVPATKPEIKSLAVLPLDKLSSDPA